ncbi:MAG: FHA domain-containing protein [Actinobacteria bacterium]|nr:FHA domain-containing protein [Actinomycetota bacterium]
MDKNLNKNNNFKAKKTESIIEQKIEIKEEISPELFESLKEIPGSKSGLIVLKGPNVGEKILLNKAIFKIGRDANSDIFLDDITISRKHAQIEKTDNNYKIIDMGSLNGVYINGKLVEEKILENGDKIQIGKYVFYYFYFD